jgi:hypothetical protein
MDDAEELDRLAGLQRSMAAIEAELAAGMAAFVAARRSEFLGGEWATDELAVALRCGRGRVLGQVQLAQMLAAKLPATWAAWRAGEIDGYKAGKVAETAQRLIDPDRLSDFDTAAAAAATAKSGPQLQSWLTRKVARIEPDQVAERYCRAFRDRRIDTSFDLDGMGRLWATTSAIDLAAIDVQLARMAKALGADDPRTLEQRRVDLFTDRLLGRDSSTSTSSDDGRVDGHASAEAAAYAPPAAGKLADRTPAPAVAVTVLGLDDTPAQLSGGGAAVPPSVARDLLTKPDTLVYRLLTDPVGNLLDVTQLGRFPTAKLGFAVEARDQTCLIPTCTKPAVRCDLDHTEPHPDGPTAYWNLGPLCRRHHRWKTSGLIQLRQLQPGVFELTMPTGHQHIIRAEPQPVGEWPADDEQIEPGLPPDTS